MDGSSSVRGTVSQTIINHPYNYCVVYLERLGCLKRGQAYSIQGWFGVPLWSGEARNGGADGRVWTGTPVDFSSHLTDHHPPIDSSEILGRSELIGRQPVQIGALGSGLYHDRLSSLPSENGTGSEQENQASRVQVYTCSAVILLGKSTCNSAMWKKSCLIRSRSEPGSSRCGLSKPGNHVFSRCNKSHVNCAVFCWEQT